MEDSSPCPLGNPERQQSPCTKSRACLREGWPLNSKANVQGLDHLISDDVFEEFILVSGRIGLSSTAIREQIINFNRQHFRSFASFRIVDENVGLYSEHRPWRSFRVQTDARIGRLS